MGLQFPHDILLLWVGAFTWRTHTTDCSGRTIDYIYSYHFVISPSSRNLRSTYWHEWPNGRIEAPKCARNWIKWRWWPECENSIRGGILSQKWNSELGREHRCLLCLPAWDELLIAFGSNLIALSISLVSIDWSNIVIWTFWKLGSSFWYHYVTSITAASASEIEIIITYRLRL